MQNNIEIGKRIKKLRTKRGLSQLDLELLINASSGSISRIENGKVNPTKETLASISRGLSLNYEEAIILFGIEEIISFK